MKPKKGRSPKDLLNAVFRHIHILLLVLVLLPLGTLVACFLVTPVYESDARLMIMTVAARTGAPDAEGGRGKIAERAASPSDVSKAKETLQGQDLWLRTAQALGTGNSREESGSTLKRQVKILAEKVAGNLSDKKANRPKAPGQSVHDFAATARQLSRDCIVSTGAGAGTLEVSFRYDDPAMARRILSTHVSGFIKQVAATQPLPEKPKKVEKAVTPKPVKEKTAKHQSEPKNVESTPRNSEQSTYLEEYERVETRLAEFKKKWKLVFPEKQKEELYAEIAGKKKSLHAAEGEISRVQSLLEALKSSPATLIKQVLGGEGEEFDNSIRAAVSKLAEAMRRHETIKQRFVETSRDVRDSEEKVRDASVRVERILEADLAVKEAKQAALEADISAQEEQLAQLEQRIEELKKLELDVSIAKERYVRFSVGSRVTPKTTAQSPAPSSSPAPSTSSAPQPVVEKNAVTPQRAMAARLIKPPSLPDHALFPRTGLYVLVSLIAALPLGLIAVAVASSFNRTFDTPDHVERATGYKVLASFQRLRGPSRPFRVRRSDKNR